MNSASVSPAPVPILFVLWHREHRKGSRWKKAGRYGSRAEALNAIGGSGDWHIAPLYEPELAGSAKTELAGSAKTEPQPALFE